MKKAILAIKIVVDIGMMALFLLLMGYHLFGEATHEWFGIGVFVLFLIHNGLNWRWYKNLFKGKYTATRIYKLVISLALWGFMICCVYSAMTISAYVFAPLEIHGNLITGRQLHLTATMWTFLLLSVHLGLHFGLFIGIAGKIKVPNKARVAIKWILRATLFGLAIYGFIVFAQRSMWEELFLTTHFKFLDYEEPIIKFLFDYLCVVCLFGAIGYYFNKLLMKLRRQKANKNKNSAPDMKKAQL